MATTNAASPSSSSSLLLQAFNIRSHISRLFVTPRISVSSPLNFASLDGFRAMLCFWMVAFHCLFYTNSFLPDLQHRALGKHPLLRFINLGFLPVDGFFVLTGFLIALPLFQLEFKVIQALKQGESTNQNNKQLDISSLTQFSLFSYYFRRFSRVLPSYFLALIVHCMIFPEYHYSKKYLRSESITWFLDTLAPQDTGSGSGCNAMTLSSNFFQLNNHFPFGGCMGWLWSFAVQIQFYLWLPVLWKWLNRKQTKESLLTPGKKASSYLVKYSIILIIISILIRTLAYFHSRTLVQGHTTGLIMGFLWYANTFTRIHTIIFGLLIAYISVYSPKLIQHLRTSTMTRLLLWIFCFIVLTLQLSWNWFFGDGNQLEVPGGTAIEASQLTNPAPNPFIFPPTTSSIQSELSVLPQHYHHALYHIFIIVGSPCSSIFFSWLLLVTVHGIGKIGKPLQGIFSRPIFYCFSVLSFFVYLIHPAVIMKFYEYYTSIHPNWRGYISEYVYLTACIYVIVFGMAFFLHILFEQPMEVLLRQSDASINEKKPFFVRVLGKSIWYYCLLLLTASVIIHPIALYGFTQATNAEGVVMGQWSAGIVKQPLPNDF